MFPTNYDNNGGYSLQGWFFQFFFFSSQSASQTCIKPSTVPKRSSKEQSSGINQFRFQPYLNPICSHTWKSARAENCLPRSSAHHHMKTASKKSHGILLRGSRQVSVRLLTRHSMAVKVISNSLLQIVIRRSFLKPLVEIVPQVFVQSASCKGKTAIYLFLNAHN